MQIENSWLKLPKLRDVGAVMLVTLPFAGAGGSVYREWQAGLPDDVDVVSAELPGRESRLRETPLRHLDAVIASLCAAVSPLVADRPYAVFGHSLGALLGFELLRTLRHRGLPSPLCLFASGREAPTCREPGKDLHDLPDAAFIQGMVERYGGIPQALLDEPELLALFLPALKADLCLSESYVYRDEAPFGFPIHVLSGTEDRRLSADLLQPWTKQTTGAAPMNSFPGGHFFIRDSRAAVLTHVGRVLAELAPGANKASRRVTA